MLKAYIGNYTYGRDNDICSVKSAAQTGLYNSNLNIALSFENKSRWWNAYELQNYRKYSILKLGVSVNLFAQQNRKASNRQF